MVSNPGDSSRCGAMLFGLGGRKFRPSGAIPSNQLIEVVAIRAVGAERPFIEESLDSAVQADLIRVILRPHRPTHLAVPATAQYNDAHARQPSCQHAPEPQPTRLLLFPQCRSRKSLRRLRISPILKPCKDRPGMVKCLNPHYLLTKEHAAIPLSCG